MQSVRYSFGGIDGAADDIRSTSGTVNGPLGDLKKHIVPVAPAWEGESSDSYQKTQREQDTAAEELNMILTTIADTVSAGGQRMADTNRRAVANWGQFGS